MVRQPGSAVGAGVAVTSGSAFVVSGVVGTSFADVDGPPLGTPVGATVVSAGASDEGAGAGASLDDGAVVVLLLDDGLVVEDSDGSVPSSLPHAVSAPNAMNADTVATESRLIDRCVFMNVGYTCTRVGKHLATRVHRDVTRSSSSYADRFRLRPVSTGV